MTLDRVRRRAAAGLSAALLAASLAIVTAASAAPLAQDGSAVVKSVDGPTLMTLKSGKRTLRVRLDGVDAPSPGECGATETTAALKGFVRRAPRKVHYSLYRFDTGGYERDDDGRLVAVVDYDTRDHRDFGNDLVAAEWARQGYAIGLDTPPAPSSTPTSVGTPRMGERQPPPPPRALQGIWSTCGGRVHAPLGTTIEPAVPAPWSITDRGITTAIGPIPLSPERTRAAAITFRQLAALIPTELTIDDLACAAYVPSLQVTAHSDAPDLPCGDAEVSEFTTYGPGRVVASGGIGDADDRAAIRGAFPLVDLLDRDIVVDLGGLDAHGWAWQTSADLEDLGGTRVLGLTTSALPPRRG